MRLDVQQHEKPFKEFNFNEGPVYFGRGAGNQVHLPDRAISRQHAVIYETEDKKWMLEDLDSANKTYLNGEAIHKSELGTGDFIRIGDFTVKVSFDDKQQMEQMQKNDLEDTMAGDMRGPQIIIREIMPGQAPPIRFPGLRSKDFFDATHTISQTPDLDHLLTTLLDILMEQFSARHGWVALRDQPGGPMTCHAGKDKKGEAVDIAKLQHADKIKEAVERNKFYLYLFSRTPSLTGETKKEIRSLMIAPVRCPAGTYGIMYLDNMTGDDHYSLSDLDYLMLLGIHTATVIDTMQ